MSDRAGRLRLLGRLVAFPIFAVLGYIPLIAGWPNDHWFTQTILIGLLSYSWFCVGGLSHELSHGNLGTPNWLNRAIAHLIGTFIAIPLTIYREAHLRHHAYLNTPLDTELWPYSSPNRSLAFRRVFVWLDVVFGVFTAPLIYGVVFFHRQVPLRPEVRRKAILEYAAVIVFWSAAGAAMLAGLISGAVDVKTLATWFAPLAIASSMNSLRKLTEHLGMSSYDPVLGTRTLMATNPLTKLAMYFNFDLAVHGPHHRHPRLPHTQLGLKMDELCDRDPEVRFPVYTSVLGLVRDTVECMVRNPGVGVNAGGHQDFGHLPGLSDDSHGENLVPVTPEHRRAA